MRGRVVQEDDGGRESKSAGGNLEEHDECDAEPDPEAGCGGWGLGAAGQERDVRGKEISQREEKERATEAAHETETGVGIRIEEELQDNAYEADDCHCETDCMRRKGETACEFESGTDGDFVRCLLVPSFGVRIVLASGGEEENPEGAEGAHVEVENGNADKSPTNVACPDPAEGQTLRRALFLFAILSKSIQLNAAFSRFVHVARKQTSAGHGSLVDKFIALALCTLDLGPRSFC